ncbi:MAG: glycosyltransferase [Chitinophagales bacterium]
MQLSVIIVNYNVKYFLAQALQSVYQSKCNFQFEVFVVDNHSVDGSIEMVSEQFPQTHLIASKQNLGFSKANNLAIKQAKGQYILLLNPDTIVKEDTFQKVIDFMEDHPEAGAMGIKMMDGNGQFLPESKRGFPTPYVAFCKMSGLSKLFPRSKKFNQYHLGYLDKNEIHEVDVLSGAFMLLRKTVIDKVGALDEDYFMYGEDIDLSFRIKQAGYKNYYFPHTEIIHFKGESTKKGSYNYVRMFYNAMIIFTQKHFTGSKAKYLTTLLSLAIYARASLSFIRRMVEKIAWPVVDAGLIFSAMLGIKYLWEHEIKAGIQYPATYIYINIPLYIIIWLSSFFFSGGYDSATKLKKIIPGIGIGSIIILAIYALLPLSLRSSRAMILLGAIAAIILMLAARLIFLAANGKLKSAFQQKSNVLVVASDRESKRIIDIISVADLRKNVVGIANNLKENTSSNNLGDINDIPEIVKIHRINEIIFSLKDISSNEAMKIMSTLGGKIEYRIISEGSDTIIGSNSKHSSGDLYTLDINFNLNQPHYKRVKRLVDLLLSILLLLCSPLIIWAIQSKLGFLKNIIAVLFGQKTWVGYTHHQENELPKIRSAVLPIIPHHQSAAIQHKANVTYAKSYTWSEDVIMIFKHFRSLGQ